jgi:hypothetical protein
MDYQYRNPMRPAVLENERTFDAFSVVARVAYVRTMPREATQTHYTYVEHFTSFDFSAPDWALPMALSFVAPVYCGLSIYAKRANCMRT